MGLMVGDCFFLILASFDLLIVGVEVYFHPLSLIGTHIHTRRTPVDETDIHAPVWIRIRNASKRETAHPHLRPRGCRNRPIGDFNGKLRREVFVTAC